MIKDSQLPDDPKLSALLRECRPAPDLPPGFQNAVWRRIERAEARPSVSPPADWLDRLAAWFLRPGRALAVAAAMLVLGISLGVLEGASRANDLAKARYLNSVSPLSMRQ
jgi:hypothetical protein